MGNVHQVLMDPATSRVRYAVIEVNKAWQIPDPEVAVPFGALKISGKPADANFKISVDATKDKLTNAPKFKVGEAERLYTRELGTPVYTYWSIHWFEDPTPAPNRASSKKSEPAKK